jgi:hypothetical protein
MATTSKQLPECHFVDPRQGDLFGNQKPHTVEWRRQKTSTNYHIVAWCRECWRPVSGGIFPSHALFTEAEREAMPWVDSDEPVQFCPICNTAQRLEEHHLAPRAKFPDEFHLWPTVNVCRKCHDRWHERMGDRVGKPGAAA